MAELSKKEFQENKIRIIKSLLYRVLTFTRLFNYRGFDLIFTSLLNSLQLAPFYLLNYLILGENLNIENSFLFCFDEKYN